MLAAWFPRSESTLNKPPQDPAVAAMVWLLTQSWFADWTSRLVGLVASKRRLRRIVNREQKPPVVVVGNLVAGGSGKTPLVIALVQQLSTKGLKLALLCSGYGGRRKGVLDLRQYVVPTLAWQDGWSDEAVLMAMQTGALVAVGADRNWALSQCLQADPRPDLIIADDGLQHQGLERALEVLMIDARGLGNRRCLPAGPLREPLKDRPPSDWAVFRGRAEEAVSEAGVSSANLGFDGAEPGQLAKSWVTLKEAESTVMTYSDWIARSAQTTRLSDFAVLFRGRKMLGIAGISQPDVIAAHCARFGLDVHWLFPGDHRALKLEPAMLGSFEAIVMTAKDAVKYGELPIPVYVLVQTVIAPEALCLELERIAHGPSTIRNPCLPDLQKQLTS